MRACLPHDITSTPEEQRGEQCALQEEEEEEECEGWWGDAGG